MLKNFKEYIKEISSYYDFEINFTDEFIGDKYLHAVWYSPGTTVAEIKKSFLGHQFRFMIVSQGGDFISIKNKESNIQKELNKKDFVHKFGLYYGINDSLFLSDSSKITEKRDLVQVVGQDHIFEFLPAYWEIMCFYDDCCKGTPVLLDAKTLKCLLFRFSKFYLRLNALINRKVNKQLGLMFTPTCTGEALKNESEIQINEPLLPDAALYSIRNINFSIKIRGLFKQQGVDMQYTKNFLGLKFASAFWYKDNTCLAELTYRKGLDHCKAVICTNGTSETRLKIMGKEKCFLTEQDKRNPDAELIDDLRLFYGLKDADLFEFYCSTDKNNYFYFLDPSSFRISYYENGILLSEEVCEQVNILEVLYFLYTQEVWNT